MAYWDFHDLPRRTASDKLLHDKALYIAKVSNYNGYQLGLPSTVFKFFDEKFGSFADKTASCSAAKSEIMPKCEKQKVLPSFVYNTWVPILQICN